MWSASMPMVVQLQPDDLLSDGVERRAFADDDLRALNLLVRLLGVTAVGDEDRLFSRRSGGCRRCR